MPKNTQNNTKFWLSFGVLMGAFGVSQANAQTANQCYPDAISAYNAMMTAQHHAKKQAERLNINTATASDFASLLGVGVSTAERIIEYRTQVGRFGSVDDLANVKGIGQATLNKNSHRLSVAD